MFIIEQETINNALVDMELTALVSDFHHMENVQRDYCRDNPNEVKRWNMVCERLARAENANVRRSLRAELFSTDYYWKVGKRMMAIDAQLAYLKFVRRGRMGLVSRN
jgi:hypothetical protein